MLLLKHFFPIATFAQSWFNYSLSVFLYLASSFPFPFSIFNISTITSSPSPPPPPSLSYSLSCSDWQVWWCLSLLSLTFNSHECMHKHTLPAHSKTANGVYLRRLCQLEITVPVQQKRKLKTYRQTEHSEFTPLQQRKKVFQAQKGRWVEKSIDIE